MLPISNKRRVFVKTNVVVPDPVEVVERPAQHYFRVLKAGISDGVSSATGIYDDLPGDVPVIFNPAYDNLDLADALLRQGSGAATASKVASEGVQSQS